MASSSWMHVAVAQAGSVEDVSRQSWQSVAARHLPASESIDSSWQQFYPAVRTPPEATNGYAEVADVEAMPNQLAIPVPKAKGRPKKKTSDLSRVDGVPSIGSAVQINLVSHCHGSPLESAVAVNIGDLGIGSSGLVVALPDPGQSLHKALQGYTLPSVNTEALFHVMAHFGACTGIVDEDYNKLSGTFLSAEQPFHHQSVIARAAALDVSRKTVSTKLFRLASAQCIAARAVRHFIEKEVASHFTVSQRLCYVECVCYDETPLRFGSKGVVQAVSAGDGEVTQLISRGLSNDVAVTSGMLHLYGATVNPLQCLQRGTAEVLAKALQGSSAVSQQASLFQVQTRIACTDRASANSRAEILVTQEKGGQWQSLQHHCEVHKTAGSFKR
eukprot:3491274-Amphidinium_carterae.1